MVDEVGEQDCDGHTKKKHSRNKGGGLSKTYTVLGRRETTASYIHPDTEARPRGTQGTGGAAGGTEFREGGCIKTALV